MNMKLYPWSSSKNNSLLTPIFFPFPISPPDTNLEKVESKFIFLFRLSKMSPLNLLLLISVYPISNINGSPNMRGPSVHPGWNFQYPNLLQKSQQKILLFISWHLPCLHQTNRYITCVFYIYPYPWLISVPILQVVFLLEINQLGWDNFSRWCYWSFSVEYSNHHDFKNSKNKAFPHRSKILTMHLN